MIMLHQRLFVGAILALAVAVAAQENQQPTFIDPFTNRTVNANETACLAQLNWPKCYGWNFRNTTLADDPGFEKIHAQTCTPECLAMKASLSREYVESKCGPNPILPRRIRLDRMELARIQAQYSCAKDETGKRSCGALHAETWVAAKFNESEHMGPMGDLSIPWAVVPRDYACSKCMLEDLKIDTQIDKYYERTLNITRRISVYNRTEAGMNERVELCKGWKPSAIKGGAAASPAPATPGEKQPSAASAAVTMASSVVAMVGAVVAVLVM